MTQNVIHSTDTIIEEINNDIQKLEDKKNNKNNTKIKYDKFMCRLGLFNFFQIKYMDNRNLDSVGYPLSRSKEKTYTLTTAEIATLSAAGILTEIKDNIDYGENYYTLLTQINSEAILNYTFDKVIKENNIPCDTTATLQEKFGTIKNYDINLLKTYEENGKNFRKNAYFHFRFFRLSDKYALYEKLLWEALKKEFGWRLQYKMVRSL